MSIVDKLQGSFVILSAAEQPSLNTGDPLPPAQDDKSK